MAQTCVQFEELSTNADFEDNHILITRKSTGWVGRSRQRLLKSGGYRLLIDGHSIVTDCTESVWNWKTKFCVPWKITQVQDISVQGGTSIFKWSRRPWFIPDVIPSLAKCPSYHNSWTCKVLVFGRFVILISFSQCYFEKVFSKRYPPHTHLLSRCHLLVYT